MFPVYDVTSWAPQRPETLGSKAKDWVLPAPDSGLPPSPHLFKIGRPNTGENWAEKVACEIAKALELPCANYNLAMRGRTLGVISERFIPAGANFAFGNLILSQMIPQYDSTLRFKQESYQLRAMLGVLRVRGIGRPLDCLPSCAHLTGSEVFVGYLILDALIGNSDRHHDNWGVIVTSENGVRTFHLAPTFDHASSLGREQTSEAAIRRLTTRDRRGDVEAYAGKCRTAFYSPDPNPKILTSRELLTALAETHPEPVKFWAQKAVSLSDETLEGIFSQVDGRFISEEAIRFALRLLCFNRRQISEVVLA